MARTFALSTLVTRCKQRVDQENSDLIGTAEWKGLISSAYARLHSVLVESGLRYFESEQTLTAQSTALPAAYLSTLGVDFVSSGSVASGERRPLQEIMRAERHAYVGSTGAEPLVYELKGSNIIVYPAMASGRECVHTYAPQPTDYSAGQDADLVDVVTADGEEFLIWWVAIRASAKEGDMAGVQTAERNAGEALARLQEDAVLRSLETPRRPVLVEGAGYGRDAFFPIDWRWR